MAFVANTNTNVDTGRPKVGGYAFSAPLGTELPADHKAELNEAFLNMGYVSKDGISLAEERNTTDQEDWGGTVIETTQESFSSTVTATFLESLRGDLLKAIYGKDNVTIVEPTDQAEGSVHVKHNATELDNAAWVFEMASRRSRKRIVLPNARITAVGEVKFVAAELISYQCTIKAYPDAGGDCVHEYKSLPKKAA